MTRPASIEPLDILMTDATEELFHASHSGDRRRYDNARKLFVDCSTLLARRAVRQSAPDVAPDVADGARA